MKSAIVMALLSAPSAAFIAPAATRALVRPAPGLRPLLSMAAGEDDENVASWRRDLKKRLAAAGAIAAVTFGGLTGLPDVASAAKSGGRVGGGSFRSAPSRPSGGGGGGGGRSYAPRTYGGGGGGGLNLNVYPSVGIGGGFGYSPFFSPFSFGSPFGYSPLLAPGGVAVVQRGWGINPLDILFFGGAAIAISSLLRGGVSGAAWEGDDSSALGAGTSVVKLQVALVCPDRGPNSILAQLQDLAGRADTSSGRGLAVAASEAALALVRRQSDWVSAASDYKHFGGGAANRAEQQFNSFAIETRSKVERETVARVGGRDIAVSRSYGGSSGSGGALEKGRPTLAVVTLVVALRGDSMKALQLERSVNSAPALRKALTQLAADAMADDGQAVMAAELLWTPEEPWESLGREEVTREFPELIDV